MKPEIARAKEELWYLPEDTRERIDDEVAFVFVQWGPFVRGLPLPRPEEAPRNWRLN